MRRTYYLATPGCTFNISLFITIILGVYLYGAIGIVLGPVAVYGSLTLVLYFIGKSNDKEYFSHFRGDIAFFREEKLKVSIQVHKDKLVVGDETILAEDINLVETFPQDLICIRYNVNFQHIRTTKRKYIYTNYQTAFKRALREQLSLEI